MVIAEKFAMMRTLFTQYMWARLQILMSETNLKIINPSTFKSESEDTLIDGVVANIRVNNPVESVSWENVTAFIDKLNNLSKSGDAEIQKKIASTIVGHQKGDIYALPSDEQWEFVLRNRGNANKDFFDRDDHSEITQYAWVKENSNDHPHEVGLKLPRIVDGNPFYDLEGNVYEFTSSFIEDGKTQFAIVRGGFLKCTRK